MPTVIYSKSSVEKLARLLVQKDPLKKDVCYITEFGILGCFTHVGKIVIDWMDPEQVRRHPSYNGPDSAAKDLAKDLRENGEEFAIYAVPGRGLTGATLVEGREEAWLESMPLIPLYEKQGRALLARLDVLGNSWLGR